MLYRAIIGFVIFFAILPAAQAEPQSPLFYSWTGWYVGVNAGRGWGSGGLHLDPTGHGSGAFPNEEPFILASQIATLGPTDIGNSGSLGGVQSGYNFQFGAIVVGVEADYDWADISGSHSGTLHSEFNIPNEPGFGVTSNLTASEKLETLGTLRGRLGFTPTPALLLFGTGGLAFGRASSNFNVSQFETSAAGPGCIGFTDASGNGSKFLSGWTAGGGAELALGPNVSAKVEYLHYDLGRMHYKANGITDISCPPSSPFASVSLNPSADIDGDIVHVGLNLKLFQ